MRSFAKLLIAYEASEKKSSETKSPDGFNVAEKLRLHLATYLGKTGCHTILARALALSTAEVPWLRAVQVNQDGSLEGAEKFQAQLVPGQFSEGKLVLLAWFLGLLVVFIGENYTVRAVREVWPKVLLNCLDFGKKVTNEKTN
jgi:hypothetical protein